MHNKCNATELSWNHSPHPSVRRKKMSSMKLVPGAKKIGDHCYAIYINWNSLNNVEFFALLYPTYLFNVFATSL